MFSVGMVRKKENLVVVLCDRLNSRLLMMVVLECEVLGINVMVWVKLSFRVFVMLRFLILFIWMMCLCFLVYRIIKLFMMKVRVMGIGWNRCVLMILLRSRLRMVSGMKVIVILIMNFCVFVLLKILLKILIICC